jgi:hypothetical protein
MMPAGRAHVAAIELAMQTAVILFLLLAVGGLLPAQWGVVRPSPFVVQGSAIAGYDPVSGEAYLFRGSEAWRFDEAVWNRVPTPGSAAPVFGPSCSWPGHGLMVVAGTTWVWNGAAWAQTVTAHSPTGLFGLDWDPARGVAVGLGVALDTWEFDGVDWFLRTTAWPAGGPPVSEAKIAFDPIRQRTMAVAGLDYGGPNGFSTYEWDGATWSLRGPSAAHYGFALSSVPGRGVVISGGGQFPFYFGPTSLWNGTQWIGVGTGAPFPRPTSLSWFDSARGRLVITSGLGTNSISPASAGAFGVWYWDGSQWSRPVVGDGPPFYAPAAWDSWRGRLLRYGGMQNVGMELDELWSRDSATGVWSMLGPGPGARANHVCAFDSRRGRLVVFGGSHFDSGSGADYLVDPLRTSEWVVPGRSHARRDGLRPRAWPLRALRRGLRIWLADALGLPERHLGMGRCDVDPHAAGERATGGIFTFHVVRHIARCVCALGERAICVERCGLAAGRDAGFARQRRLRAVRRRARGPARRGFASRLRTS